MRFLLDTHTFIWWDSQIERLSERAKAICQDPENELFLSVGSLWEIQIKGQLGKVKLNRPLADLVQEQQDVNNIILLNVKAQHIFFLDELPLFHKDPFDRILIAQAKVENLSLISNDEVMKNYPIPVEW
jgi:PIN domain nuclease of toxin-antitoxin system